MLAGLFASRLIPLEVLFGYQVGDANMDSLVLFKLGWDWAESVYNFITW